MEMQQLLKFSEGNSKLPKSTLIFALPSGYTCPGAKYCHSTADRTTGKIKDGPDTKFRCYSASYESLYSNTRAMVWYNFDLLSKLRNKKEDIHVDCMANLLYTSICPYIHKKRRNPDNVIRRIRIHSSGDFYSLSYFKAWIQVARKIDLIFYAYTKCLPMWLELKDLIPGNLILTASVGGRYDSLLSIHSIFKRQAHVVMNQDMADQFGFPVDHDDTYAYSRPATAFAHLVHGVQPAQSDSVIAIQDRKKNGDFIGYGKTFQPVLV